MDQMSSTTRPGVMNWLASPTGLAAAVLIVAVGAVLATYHLEHVVGALPFAFILLCPLMHLFMHGGHGAHAGHGSGSQSNDSR
jgi:choline-glycine betaine transporter